MNTDTITVFYAFTLLNHLCFWRINLLGSAFWQKKKKNPLNILKWMILVNFTLTEMATSFSQALCLCSELYRYCIMLLLRLRKENNFHIIFPFKTFALWSTEGFKMLLKSYTNISLWRLTFSEQTVHMIWSGVCFSFHNYTSWARRQLQRRWGNTRMDCSL